MGDLGGYTVSARCCVCREVSRVQTWRGDNVDWVRHICWLCRQKGCMIGDGNLLSNDNDYDAWEIITTSDQLEDDYKTYKQEQKAEREARQQEKERDARQQEKARNGGTDG